MDRIARHKEIFDQIHETYIQKNRAYGNSFDKSYLDYGPVAALVRMSDKWNRLNSLMLNPDIPQGDESVKDTLLDLANYCVMTVMAMETKDICNKADEIVKESHNEIEN